MAPDQPHRHRGLSATLEGVSFVLVFDTGLTELLSHVMRSCARDKKSIWTDEDRKKELTQKSGNGKTQKGAEHGRVQQTKRVRTLMVVMFAKLKEDCAISVHCLFRIMPE